ncbi:MAG: phytoene desaturase family protein [Promethearchaeota archaeon]
MENLNELSKEKWDYIVVGAGLAGLGVASILTHGGRKVLVLEKENEIGGRARPTKKDGFILDNGLHLLRYGRNSTLFKIFKYANIQDDDIKIIPIKNYYVYISPNDEHLKKVLDKDYIESNKWIRKGWIEVPYQINKMRKCDYFNIWKLIRIYTTCFKCEYNDIKNISLRKFLAGKRLCKLRGCYEIERYLQLISTALLHITDSNEISAGEIFRTLKWMTKQEILFGYPAGGWSQIIEKFKNKIKTKGKIITECEVNEVLIENLDEDFDNNKPPLELAKVIGVKTNLGKFYADNVVLSIQPQKIPSLFINLGIIHRLNPSFENLLKNIKPTAGISIDIALNSIQYKSKTFMYLENPFGYGATISNIDPSLAPPGKQLLSFIFPIPYQMIKKSAMIKEFIEKCRESIFIRYPKIKDNILFERILIHKNLDNVKLDPEHYWENRPKSKIPGIQGAYLVGDFIRTFGSSGELTYNAVLDACTKMLKYEKKLFI